MIGGGDGGGAWLTKSRRNPLRIGHALTEGDVLSDRGEEEEGDQWDNQAVLPSISLNAGFPALVTCTDALLLKDKLNREFI